MTEIQKVKRSRMIERKLVFLSPFGILLIIDKFIKFIPDLLVPVIGISFLIGIASLAVILKKRKLEQQNQTEVDN